MKYRLVAMAIVAVFLWSQPASALTYNITDVSNLTSQGFSTSVFHTATSNGGKGGVVLARSIGGTASGTWDSVSGAINVWFDVERLSDNLTIDVHGTGNLSLTGVRPDGFMGIAGTIEFAFSAALDDLALVAADVQFLDYDYNIGPDPDPNGFDSVAGLIALWGADGIPTGSHGLFQTPASLGADLRIELTPVTIPAALPLFAGGLGIMGLLGWRRKRRAETV